MLVRALAFLVLVAACPSKKSPPVEKQPEPPPGPAVVVPIPPAPPFEVPAPADKLVAIGRGLRHACVVRESGAVDCWGQHRTCTRCTVPPPADHTVRRATGVSDATAISGDGTCVLRKTGEVACLASDRLELVTLAGVAGVTSLDTGDSSCFVHGDGRVSCRDPETQHVDRIPNIRDAISVSSDSALACVVRKSGEVMCGPAWGQAKFIRIAGIPRVKEISVGRGGWFHPTCYIAVDNTVDCMEITYSADSDKPLHPTSRDEGNGTFLSDRERFKGATHVRVRSVGNIETYAMSVEAVVNGHVLGNDLRGSTSEEVAGLTDAVTHAQGCAIRGQGSLVCWGNNDGGVLAQPTTIDMLTAPPAPVVGVGDVIDIALGTRAGYALTRKGEVLRWGRADLRRWGLGSARAELVPLGLGPHDLVEIIADYEERMCLRSKNGEVWCQMEHRNANDRRLDQVDTQDITSISMNDGRLLAVRRDGRAEMHMVELDSALSTSEEIELGADVIGGAGWHDGFRCWMHRDHTIGCPNPIQGLDHPTVMAIGPEFGCAIQRGNVLCWTYLMDKGVIPIEGLHDATDIAAGPSYACAVHSKGKVSCFHFEEVRETDEDKAKDQASDANAAPRVPQLKISPIVDVIAADAVDIEISHGSSWQIEASHQLHGPIAAGETACAIMRDYTVRCWGTNLGGETGDGSLIVSDAIGVKL